MQTIDDLFEGGEDALTARLARLAATRLPRGTVGIGDDAAVLGGTPVRVITVDLLVEGQHFRHDLLTPEDLAHRALEANLSDIAAMGAHPEAIFLGLAWPAGRAASRGASRLLAELIRAAGARGAPVLGGDTVRSAKGAATLSVTVVGTPYAGGPVLRSGGQPGDVLAVTGALGGSGTGLRLLSGAVVRSRDRGARAAAADAIAAFRRPRARLDLAAALARNAAALMDLSDGLGLDLPRLAAASGCGFVVEADQVPIHPATVRFEDDALLRALGGGEDFELLAAFRPERLAAARRAVRRAGGDLHVIGQLAPRRARCRLRINGKLVEWPRTGWDPFGPGTTFSSRSGRPARAGSDVRDR